MKYLFFFVHPSKFHLFRNTINALKAKGNTVDILIASKDVLEELVINEGWNYTNIFPEGRRMKNVSPYVSSIINGVRTIYRVYKYLKGKKYDIIISDDLVAYLAKIRKIPVISNCDDDLSLNKKMILIYNVSDYILSPDITDLGEYNRKKIGYPGYKELAYLHPNHFFPDIEVVKKIIPELTPYFILRLVSLKAHHDGGIKGLSNIQIKKLIDLLIQKGQVFISAERELPLEFEKYRLKINPNEIAHFLYYAQMFIGDSQTMTSEAAILGTPAFRCNDFVGRISVMEEKETKYGLSLNFTPDRFDEMYDKISELLLKNDFKKDFQIRRMLMLKDKIDLSAFMIWLFTNYPSSIEEIKCNSLIWNKFKLQTN